MARRLKQIIADAKPSDWSAEWAEFYQEEFYREVFGLTVDLSEVKLPPETEGFGWTLAIAKELGDKPLARVLAVCGRLFPTRSYLGDDPDQSVLANDRDPRIIGSYAISVRDRVEADKENKDISANTVKSRNMVTMTMLERIVLELFYFWKTGNNHLDIQNWTLCSGSRYSRGDVPYCHWHDDWFWVSWCYPGSAGGFLRVREAVLA